MILAASIFISCNSEHVKIPSDILKQDKMAQVLADVQLVESTIIVRGDDEQLQSDSLNFYSEIFEKHEVDQETFEKSMKYYSLHPELLEGIYDEVIITLSERLAQLEGTQESEENESK